MKTQLRSYSFGVFLLSALLGVLCASSSSAAPSVTHLFPAGGQRGSTVEVTATGTFGSWPVKAWVSGKGVTATVGKRKGKLSISIAPDAVPGLYWLRLHDADGGGNLRPFFVGTLPEVIEKEPNDEAGKGQPLTASAVVNGRLQSSGDVDCFAIKAKKGQTLVASLEANQTLKSPMDGLLQVVSPDGFVLEQNHDFHGLDPQIAYEVPKDGTYVVRVFAFPSQPDSGIRFAGAETFIYRLTITTEGFADHALPLAVSRSNPGKVELAGWNIPDTARQVSVPVADDQAFLYHPQVANAVRVRLEPHATFLCSAMPADPQTPSFTVTGRLDKAGDVNVLPFAGKKGQRLLIQVESEALGFPLIPVLRVLDTAGKQLVRVEPGRSGRDVELSFTPPSDGVYRVEIRDLYEGGGRRYLYCLRVLRADPDFELTVASDRFQVVPGKPLDIPVSVVRQNGFKDDVELSVEGLPAGITATLLKPTSKAITLRIAADKLGLAGAFRLVGVVKGQPEVRRLARANLAEFGMQTSDLWVSSTTKATTPVKPRRKRR